ncbi:MAG: YihY/virulence factor BrkB family protein [Bacteroidales bacterium]|nr:YihY/virulence factor BrkB family protein [Bacteroidales bacterium]
MPQKEKKDGKLNTWFQAKVKAVTDWYNRDDNFLRRIRFPGTRLPLLTVVINFIKLFTKGRTIDRAAGVAFNFFVALFPLVLFFFTLIPYIPIPHLYERVMMFLNGFLIPSGTLDYVRETIDSIMNQPHDGLLSISIVLCLVFGSSGVVAFFNGFRNVYADYVTSKGLGLKGWIIQRVFALVMLIIIGVLIVISVLLISLGGTAIRRLVENNLIEGGSFTFFLFIVMRWVVGIFTLSISISMLYYFGNVRFNEHYRKELKRPRASGKKYREFVIFSPGTILATTLFVLGTVGFNAYISNFSRYNVLYGSIGTLIILLLWFWVVAILILAGNDLNSGIRREANKLSSAEDATRRKKIVIDDLRKHIVAYQAANENRVSRIEELRKEMKEKEALIQDMEEKKKDYELIIKTYQDYAEQERRISDEQYDVSFESRKEIEHPGNQA